MNENRVNRTRFMKQGDFAKVLTPINLSDTSYPIGGMPLMVDGQTAYIDESDNHALIFGATGSRKTRTLIMPTLEILCRAGESFVVTDPKGELFKRTAKLAGDRDYDVVCIDLREIELSDAWNPLLVPYDLYHSGYTFQAMTMISDFAQMLSSVMSDEKDKFWSASGQDFIMGLVLILMERADRQQCNVGTLISLWREYKNEKEAFIEKVKKEFANTLVEIKLENIVCSSDKTLGSIEAIVSTALNQLIINSQLLGMMSAGGLDLQEIADKKMAIYLIVPDENKSTHFIASLFIKQLYDVLIMRAQWKQEGKLEHRMNFVLDEFANIPHICDMDSMITAARSRNIRFYLVTQGQKQLQSKYEKETETIKGNCNNWIYLYSKESALLEELSTLCGEVVYENNVTLPLISGFELQHLNKETCECLVLSGRNCPCIVNLKDIDDYPFERYEELVRKPNRYSEKSTFHFISSKGPGHLQVDNKFLLMYGAKTGMPETKECGKSYVGGLYRGSFVVFTDACDMDNKDMLRYIYRNNFGTEDGFEKITEWMEIPQELFYKRIKSKTFDKKLMHYKDIYQDNADETSREKLYDYIQAAEQQQDGYYQATLKIIHQNQPIRIDLGSIPANRGGLDAYLVVNYAIRIAREYRGRSGVEPEIDFSSNAECEEGCYHVELFYYSGCVMQLEITYHEKE